MIKVTYYPKFNQLTIEGHAQAASKGEDVVCASVSTLWHTLAANAMTWKEKGYLRDLRSQERDGYAQLSYVPCAPYRNILSVIAQSIVLGLELLAEYYPENIAFIRMGG